MNKKNVLIGVIGLLAGAGVYVVNRAQPVYFLEKVGFIKRYSYLLPDIYGKLGGWLPEFFHAFSFSLISIGLFSRTKISRNIFCLLWLGIDSFFEIGQKYGSQLARYIPLWFNKVPILKRTESYFVNGRFDILDLLAILSGVVVAYILTNITTTKPDKSGNYKFSCSCSIH